MTQENPSWSYIAYAPRSSIVAQVKGAIAAWAVLMIISGGIALVLNLGAFVAQPVTSAIKLPAVPWWLILTIGSALFLWFMRDRGVEFARNARALTRTQCIVIIGLLGVQFYAWANLHWLIAIGITWGWVVAVFSLDRLSAEGKAALERSGGAPSDAA